MVKRMFIFLGLLISLYSCKKTGTGDNNIPDVPKKKALFKAKPVCKTLEFHWADSSIQYIDSLFKFENQSDSIDVSYAWTFGDGSTSNDRHPFHAYQKTGIYNVRLITYFNNQPSDTFS